MKRFSVKHFLFLGTLFLAGYAQAANVAGQLNYRKPNLEFVSVSTVALEAALGPSSNQSKIIFPDGNLRTVTEAAADGEKNFRYFDVTQVATFTACVAGSSSAGLQEHTGLLRSLGGEAANTWYSIYAVKSQCSGGSGNFTLVGTTWSPTTGFYGQLNATFTTNGWSYVGTIRNGNNIIGTTTDILSFVQMGNTTLFNNIATDSSVATAGIFLSSSAVTASTWTYSAGFTGTAMPTQFTHGLFFGFLGNTAVNAAIANSAATQTWINWDGNASNSTSVNTLRPLANGANITSTGAAQTEIFLYGFLDEAIGFVTTP